MMLRTYSTLSLLAVLTAGAAFAQDLTSAATSGATAQTTAPAPIERSAAPMYAPAAPRSAPRPQVSFAEVAPGVWVRSTRNTRVQTVSTTGGKVELRLDHGVANLNVHHPEQRPQILVDLPGGQTAILKDGLYTFNADTNTVRTLKGEAEVFPAAQHDAKPVKVKEDHAVNLASVDLKPYEFGPMDLRGDLLPGAAPAHGDGGYGYGYGGYGDGFYRGYDGYPYWAYGPYWDDPFWGPGWGWGPGFGVGFGYVGGFHGWRR